MANADIPINVTAKELELSVTNNFVLESLNFENSTVATQDLTGDIIKISAVINRNCARYVLTSNTIKVNCVDANQVSIYETNPDTTYCVKFSDLVYDDTSKTGTGRLIIEDVTVNDDGTIDVDDYENIIAIFETDATRKYKVGSEKSYPYSYDTNKLLAKIDDKQDKLTTSNIGSGLGIDSNGKPYVPIDTELSSTSENPIANNAVFNALDGKQAKQKVELIRTFKVGDESTYNDNDIIVYDDTGNMKTILICADNNGNPFHLERAYASLTYPARNDVTSNYVATCNFYTLVALNTNGFPANINGWKLNNAGVTLNPANTYYQKTMSDLTDGSFAMGFSSSAYTSSATDSVSTWRIWNSSIRLFDETSMWGELAKNNLINGAYLYATTGISFADGTQVTIYGVRKNED